MSNQFRGRQRSPQRRQGAGRPRRRDAAARPVVHAAPHDQDRLRQPTDRPPRGVRRARRLHPRRNEEALAGGIGSAARPTRSSSSSGLRSNSNRAADATSELILKDKVEHRRRRLDARHHQPGGRPVRAERRALRDQRHAVAAPSSAAAAIRRPVSSGPTISSGASDVIGVFTSLWGQLPTNKIVGALFPNDSDGNAWGDAKLGFPPVLAQKASSLSTRAASSRRPMIFGLHRRVQEEQRRDRHRRAAAAGFRQFLGPRPASRVSSRRS